jgi:hypothetical protein
MKFDKMTREEKRVAVCEDVILQCKRPNIKVKAANGYLRVRGGAASLGCSTINKECEVCAKGGMLLGLMQNKKLKLTNFVEKKGGFSTISDEAICCHLSDIFNQEELDVIEALFEGWPFYGFVFDGWISLTGDNAFSKVKPARKRLIGIMGNIIANAGNLNFEQGPIFHKTVKVPLL